MKSNGSLPYKIELRLKGALTDHLNTINGHSVLILKKQIHILRE